jgi:hypothetical protein
VVAVTKERRRRIETFIQPLRVEPGATVEFVATSTRRCAPDGAAPDPFAAAHDGHRQTRSRGTGDGKSTHTRAKSAAAGTP